MKLFTVLSALIASLFALCESAAACAIVPKEVLWGSLLKGPLQVDTTSRDTMWAGITTLASGSATVVFSTTLVNSDSLILLGAVGNANVASGQGRAIEVKTISSGGYFTVGTCDGVSNARDTAVHFFMLTPS